MKEPLHIVLLGAGAIGVLPAVKLLMLDDVKLTVAADSGRIARYRRDGIFCNGIRIPFSYASPEDMAALPPADLVIAATKMPALPEALENISGTVGSRTVFLPVLNGISASDIISEYYPENIVLNGFFLGHASVRVENRITHDGVGSFCIGGRDSKALQWTADLFKRAGINVETPPDINSAMWKKFILNVGVNQTQAVFKADYGCMQRSPEMLDFARNLMLEAVVIAEMEHVSGTESMVDDAFKVIREMPGDVKTSMLQDILAGRQTEVDAFAGVICAKAEKYGVPVPFNRRVLEKLK